jgi:hypothetical protein
VTESDGHENVSAARVSSPASTGGAGTSFEQHVAAYWLAQLLVRGIPPILIDTVVTEVSFQTERLGWQTDDFLIVCERPGAAPQKLLGQVKRNFTVSAANDECVQAIGDFWKDFNGAHFSIDNDRLVLVTLRGTNTLLEHFVGLLDCARRARARSSSSASRRTASFPTRPSSTAASCRRSSATSRARQSRRRTSGRSCVCYTC